ncbi:MAG: hypothetical protein R3D34_08025 [Nitratireductor sp.]
MAAMHIVQCNMAYSGPKSGGFKLIVNLLIRLGEWQGSKLEMGVCWPPSRTGTALEFRGVSRAAKLKALYNPGIPDFFFHRRVRWSWYKNIWQFFNSIVFWHYKHQLGKQLANFLAAWMRKYSASISLSILVCLSTVFGASGASAQSQMHVLVGTIEPAEGWSEDKQVAIKLNTRTGQLTTCGVVTGRCSNVSESEIDKEGRISGRFVSPGFAPPPMNWPHSSDVKVVTYIDSWTSNIIICGPISGGCKRIGDAIPVPDSITCKISVKMITGTDSRIIVGQIFVDGNGRLGNVELAFYRNDERKYHISTYDVTVEQDPVYTQVKISAYDWKRDTSRRDYRLEGKINLLQDGPIPLKCRE